MSLQARSYEAPIMRTVITRDNREMVQFIDELQVNASSPINFP